MEFAEIGALDSLPPSTGTRIFYFLPPAVVAEGWKAGNACRTGVCHTVPCLGMNIARACLLCSALGLLGACAVHSAPPSHHQNTQNSSSLHNHKLQPNMQLMLYMERFSFAVSVGFRSRELGGASMQSSVLCPRSLLPPPTNPAAP